ncbi:MAG: aminotransferase class IV [Anaerolineae bacterium]
MSLSPIYWINGKYVSADEATVSIHDIGVLRGYGVFDYLRTYSGKPFRLMAHLERLRSSASQIGLSIPLDLEEIADITETLVGKNGEGDFGIRYVVTGGASANNFTPAESGNLAILIEPLSDFPDNIYTHGIKLITTHLRREFPTVKSTNYIGAIMAMREANAADAAEALYVDDQNEISECTRSNFFVVEDGRLKTPEKNVLPGITRKVILEYAAEIVPSEIAAVFMKDLTNIQEAFISSSTKEIVPVIQIDNIQIGNGKVGPITKALAARFKQETD